MSISNDNTKLIKDKQANIRLDREIYTKLRSIANKNNLSISWIIRDMIQTYFEDYKKKFEYFKKN